MLEELGGYERRQEDKDGRGGLAQAAGPSANFTRGDGTALPTAAGGDGRFSVAVESEWSLDDGSTWRIQLCKSGQFPVASFLHGQTTALD